MWWKIVRWQFASRVRWETMRPTELTEDFKDEFLKLVTNPDFAPKVLMVLRHSVAYDEAGPWIEALVAVYNHSTELSVLDLVDIFITQEISTAGTSMNTIFRDNSLGSLLITTIFKKVGAVYLRRTLGKCLKKIASIKESLEPDPHRAKAGADAVKSIQQLEYHTEKVLSSIFKSTAFCPATIQRICWLLKEKISVQFHQEQSDLVLTGFLFLRFFCPAIFNPNSSGLVKSIPSKDGRRALVLVSKIVQVLANNSLFGDAHDSHMIALNSFLKSQREPLHDFVHGIAVNASPVDEFGELKSAFHVHKPVITLVAFLHEHFIAVEDCLGQSEEPTDQAHLEQLRTLLSRVDREVEPETRKQVRLRRVLSSNFSEDIKDIVSFPRRKSTGGSLERRRSFDGDIDTGVINTISPTPTSLHLSEGLLPLVAESKSGSRTFKSPREKKKGKRAQLRALVRSKPKNASHSDDAEEDSIISHSSIVEEENELLRAKNEALKLQVQMLSDRNAFLRLENAALASRNEELTESLAKWQGEKPKRPKEKCKPIQTPRSPQQPLFLRRSNPNITRRMPL